MSVINKVLKDLDRRGHEPFSKSAASSAVERPQGKRFGLWFLGLLVLIALALVVVWWQSPDKNVMTVTESEQNPPSKPQGRAEPSVDTTAFKVPAELASLAEKRNLQDVQAEPESPESDNVQAPENKPELADSGEFEPKETIPVTNGSQNETEKSGEFSKEPVQLSAEEIAAQHIEKAQKAQQQGRLTSAEEHWRKALAVTPENKNVRKKLAALQFGRNKVSQALATLEQGFQLDPTDFGFRLLSARILEKEARPAAALSLLKQATPAATEYPEYVQKKALLAQEVGDYRTAADAYQRLIEAEPAQGRWYLGKAVAQQEFAPEAALSFYQNALNRIKHQPTIEFIQQQIALLQATESAGEQ